MPKPASKSKSLIIADYFILKNKKDKKGLTNKKLQKLLYYAQAWSLVLNNRTIFDDKIEAWVHGPAIPLIYSTFKSFGFKDIEVEVDENGLNSIDGKDRKLLDQIWSIYGNLDAGYLELLTHSEEPWQEARKGLQSDENSENEISLKGMKIYYSEKLKQSRKSSK